MNQEQLSKMAIAIGLIAILISSATLIDKFVISINIANNELTNKIKFNNSSNITVIKGIQNNISWNLAHTYTQLPKTNSSAYVSGNWTLQTSQLIKPIINTIGTNGIVIWNFMSNIISKITFDGFDPQLSSPTILNFITTFLSNCYNRVDVQPSLNGNDIKWVSPPNCVVRDIRFNSTQSIESNQIGVGVKNVTLTANDDIKPIFSYDGVFSLNRIYFNWIGAIVRSVIAGNGISISCISNNCTINDINNTSLKAGTGILISKSGNTNTITNNMNLTHSFTVWSDMLITAGVAGRGLNLLQARTEIENTAFGSRFNISASDIGNHISCETNVRVILGTANQFPRLSIRDTANTQNVLCILRINGITTGNFVQQNSTWVSKPAWLTTSCICALYMDGGNGSADYIIKSFNLLWRP